MRQKYHRLATTSPPADSDLSPEAIDTKGEFDKTFVTNVVFKSSPDPI